MKKILLAVVICLSLVACGEKNSVEKITGGSGLSGSYVSSNHGVVTLKFEPNGSVTVLTRDGSDTTLTYKIAGDKITIPGMAPSEYYINKDGNIAKVNFADNEIYIKK